MTVTPYCAACGARKQRPRARYCDACNTTHVRERAQKALLEHRRRQNDRLKAEAAIKYRAGALDG